MRRISMALSCLILTLGLAPSARSDQDVTIPVIVVVEFGDPYFVSTFDVLLNPDTKFVAGTSMIRVFTPPALQLYGNSGPADRAWQAYPDTTLNTVTYSLYAGPDIIVPPAPGGNQLDLGSFKFTTFAPAYNYPAFLDVQVIGLQTADGTPLDTQTYHVPVRFVPEPSALALMGLGLVGGVALARRIRARRPVSAG